MASEWSQTNICKHRADVSKCRRRRTRSQKEIKQSIGNYSNGWWSFPRDDLIANSVLSGNLLSNYNDFLQYNQRKRITLLIWWSLIVSVYRIESGGPYYYLAMSSSTVAIAELFNIPYVINHPTLLGGLVLPFTNFIPYHIPFLGKIHLKKYQWYNPFRKSQRNIDTQFDIFPTDNQNSPQNSRRVGITFSKPGKNRIKSSPLVSFGVCSQKYFLLNSKVWYFFTFSQPLIDHTVLVNTAFGFEIPRKIPENFHFVRKNFFFP